MANTTVLTGQAGQLKVALHIAVPNTNNAVGTNWRTAILNSGILGNPPASVMQTGAGPGQILAADLTLIQTGAVIEVVEYYSPNAVEIGQGATYLAAMYSVRSAFWLNYYQAVLNFFGFTAG